MTSNVSLPFIEAVDCIAEGLLIKASVGEVESLLVALGAQLEKDIYGSPRTQPGVLLFQLRHQQWTTLLEASETVLFDATGPLPGFWNWQLYGQFLSARLKTQVICYGTRDSDGFWGYTYWQNGTLSECMACSDSYHDQIPKNEIEAVQHSTLSEGLGAVIFQPPYLFFSTERPNLRREMIQDSYTLMEGFLAQHQAHAFFKLYDLCAEDFVQMDYAFWPRH